MFSLSSKAIPGIKNNKLNNKTSKLQINFNFFWFKENKQTK